MIVGLEDIGKMLSRRRATQRNLVIVMTAIGPRRPTLRQLLKSTNMEVRYLRFMITILRGHGIVKGEKVEGKYRYRLTPEAYREHIRVRYAKALEDLAKERR